MFNQAGRIWRQFIIILSILLFTLIIAFYQLFVYPDYRPIRLRDFISLKWLKSIHQINDKLMPQANICMADVKKIVYVNNHSIFITDNQRTDPLFSYSLNGGSVIHKPLFSPDLQQIAFLIQNQQGEISLSITALDGSGRIFNSALGTKHAQIVQWLADSKGLIIATAEQGQWTLQLITLNQDLVSITILADHIGYQGNQLTYALKPIGTEIIYPSCASHCLLNILNMSSTKISLLPVISEINEKEDRDITDIQILYYNTAAKQIAYQLKQRESAYIVGYDVSGDDNPKIYLWHNLKLNPSEGNAIDVVGTIDGADKVQRLLAFSLVRREVYIYSSREPSLRVVGISENENIINDHFGLPAGCLLVENNQTHEYIIKNYDSADGTVIGRGYEQLWIY